MSDSRSYSLKQLKIPFEISASSKLVQFIISGLISVGLTYLLRDASFIPTQDYVLFLLFFSICLWITEAIPPFAVGILIIGFIVFTMGRETTIDVKKYVQMWSDGVIWLFLGGFFLAEAIKKSKLDLLFMKIALPFFGNKSKYILLGFMVITAVMSALMSNTATTALMISTVTPIFIKLGKNDPFTKALLVGVAGAASFGGMATIIGSAPNAIAVGALEGIGIRIGFVEWMMVGTPVAALLLFLLWRVLLINYNLKGETLSLDFLQNQDSDIEPLTSQAKLQRNLVLLIFVLTFSLWLTSSITGIPNAVISGIPIVAFTMFRIIDADDVRALPWDTLMLVAGGLALGLAIQEQGLATYFVSKVGEIEFNVYVLMLAFGLLTVVLSNFMSNTAATSILVPVAISLVSTYGEIDPLIFPLLIGLSASCALFLPVSTPPNAIAYSTGYLQQKDFRLGGIMGALAGPVIIMAWILLLVLFIL